MMEGTLLTVAGVGFVLGLRHALDPDHVVAISTIVGERSGLRRSPLIGIFWGAGHALSLLAAGALVLTLKLSIPERAAAWLEGAVGLMLVYLGGRALRTALRDFQLHAHRHAHDGHEHVHLHAHRQGTPHTHRHDHWLGYGLRPFVIGVVHGLAGSASLSLLVLAGAPSVHAGLAYVAMLGLGSAVGMLLLSSALSLPLSLLQERYLTLHARFQLMAGACSLAFGLWLLAHPGLAALTASQ